MKRMRVVVLVSALLALLFVLIRDDDVASEPRPPQASVGGYGLANPVHDHASHDHGEVRASFEGAPRTTPPTPAASDPVPGGVAGVSTGEPEPASCREELLPFRHAPVDVAAIEYVTPLGLMTGSHVTPVDHQYYQNFLEPDRDIAVLSPGPGTVRDIQHLTQTLADGDAEMIDDFRLVIDHTCGLSSIFIHVGTLSPRIARVAPPPGEYARVEVALVAGEQIGSFRKNVDYNLVDVEVTLDGLLVPEHYRVEPWKIHTPDPFDYFTEPIREALVAKSLRTAEPIGGRFAYDIDGRLVGNWFEVGTDGYGGVDPERYWAGHLAVAYDRLDPARVVVSIGTFDGKSAQFGVLGNAPDPAEVSAVSGVVVYELVEYDYWIGDERWDRVSFARPIETRGYDEVFGTVLFQLVEDRILRMEAFPGVTADEVDGFTDAARTYER
ncbi:MAG: hypothetical protein ACE5GC_00185 [Acidimicrobiia bacterium]